MSLEFLSTEQVAGFGRFTGVPSQAELDRCCVLSDTDVERVLQRRRSQNRLGFAVQLVTVRMVGRFLPDPLEVPWEIVQRLAGQLGVDDPSCVKQYAERLPTQHEHAREITAVYGYRKFETDEVQREFRSFVAARAWTTTEGPRKLFERSATWLVRHKVLLPGATTLAKRVAEIREEQATRLYTAVSGLVPAEQTDVLQRLLWVPDESRISTLERLRTGPRQSTPSELYRQVDRLAELRAFGLSELDVSGIPANRLSWLARYGIGSKAGTIRGLTPDRQIATLVAMLRVLTQSATDDTMDVFDALVRENLIRRAEREAQKTRLQSLPKLSRASITLATGLKAVLGLVAGDPGDAVEKGVHRVVDADALLAVLEAEVGQSELAAALEVVDELTTDRGDPDAAVRAELLQRFPTIRRIIPPLVDGVAFGAAEGGLEALAEFRRLPELFPGRSCKLMASEVKTGLVGSYWRRLVLANPDVLAGQADQRAYITSVLEAFHTRLRRRDVFVPGAGCAGATRAASCWTGRSGSRPRSRCWPVWSCRRTQTAISTSWPASSTAPTGRWPLAPNPGPSSQPPSTPMGGYIWPSSNRRTPQPS